MKFNNSACQHKKINYATIFFIQMILILCFSFTMIENTTGQANYRKILLFAPTANNQHLVKQQAIFQLDAEGMKERDLRISPIIYSLAQKSTFKSYNVSETAFTFILIGKDKGEKLRRNSLVTLDELYQLIDGMPMRKIEMKKGKKVSPPAPIQKREEF